MWSAPRSCSRGWLASARQMKLSSCFWARDLECALDERAAETQMHKQILDKLLALEAPTTYCDVHVDGQMRKVKIDSTTELSTLALNIILVLEGSRPAYKCDSAPSLLPQVMEIAPELTMLPFFDGGRIVVLRKNEQAVRDRFRQLTTKSDMADIDRALGEVLGYPYVGCLPVPGFFVSYQVGGAVSLYAFGVPDCGYTEAVRSRITSGLERHNQALRQYGYEVSLFLYRTDSPDTATVLPEITA